MLSVKLLKVKPEQSTLTSWEAPEQRGESVGRRQAWCLLQHSSCAIFNSGSWISYRNLSNQGFWMQDPGTMK